MTRVFNTGWEHGIITAGGGGIVETLGPNPPVITAGIVRTGAYALRCDATGASCYAIKAIGGSPTKLVRREYIYIVNDFAEDTTLLSFRTATGVFSGIDYHPSTGKIVARLSGSTTPDVDGVSVVPGQWYLVDMYLQVNANPWLLDVEVNGVAIPRLSQAIAATTLDGIRWGWTGNRTGTVNFDDTAVDESGTTFPIGQGQVYGLWPDGDGTHSPGTIDCFQTEGPATLVTAWDRMDERPLASGTDNIRQELAHSTHYVEMTFENLPGEVSGIKSVMGKVRFGGGGDATTRIRSNTTDTDIFTGTMVNQQVKDALIAPDGGTWSVAKVNALLCRLGLATAVSPKPEWKGIMLEVEWSTATDVEKTDSDDFTMGDNAANPSGGGGTGTVVKLVEDTFDRANGAIGTSSSGDTWTTVDGTPVVDTNEGKFSAAAPGYGGATLDHGATPFPYTVSADITLSPTNNRVNAGLMFHSLGSRTLGLMFLKLEITASNSNGLVAIGKHDGGVSYGPFTQPAALVEGETYQVDLVVDETSVHCYITKADDPTVDIQATYTKSAADQTKFNSATEAGLRIRGGGSVTDEDDLNSTWDNFYVAEGDVHRSPGETEPPPPPPPPGGGGSGNGTLREMPEQSVNFRHSGWSSANASLGRIEGTVYTDTYMYVYGNFDQVQKRDGTWLNCAGLVRIKRVDMDVDTSWFPSLLPLPPGGRPREAIISADKSMLVVVGDFTSVNGSTRAGIAVFDAVTGVLSTLFAGWTKPGTGTLRGVAQDGTDLYVVGFFNNFGNSGQARNGAAKITSWQTSPALDGTWLPDVESGHKVRIMIVTGGTHRVAIACDTGSGPGSVNGDTCDVAVVNISTGATVWYADYEHNGPMDMDVNDTLQLVITGSRGQHATGGNALVKYAYVATGRQTYIDRFCPDGNMQGVGFYKGGKPEPFIYGVHHGNVCDPVKNTAAALQDNNQTASVTSVGIVVLDKNWVLQASPWRPRFMQASSAVGGVLKGFRIDGDEDFDGLAIGGDFTQVRPSDNSTQRDVYRWAYYKEDESSDPPDPPDPPPGGTNKWEPSGFDGGGFVNCGGINADGTIYAAGSDVGGMARSTTKAKSWEPANRGITSRVNKEISSFGWHPTDPLVCVSGAGPNLLLSEDGILSWQSVASNRSFEGHNLVGNNKGVPEKHPRNTGRHFAWMFDSAGNEFLVWGEFDTGVFVSDNRGRNPVSVGLVTPEIIVRGIRAHGITNNVVFIGAYQGTALTGGLYRITNPWGNLGSQTNKVITKLNTPFNSVEEIDTLDDYICVVGSIIQRSGGTVTSKIDGCWLSQDNGNSWNRLGAAALDEAGGWCAVRLYHAPGGELGIFVGAGTPVASAGEYRTILRSANTGVGWTWVTHEAQVHPQLGDASGDDWWQTQSSWWLSGAQAVSAQIEIDPSDPNVVVSWGRSGTWRSPNLGNDWYAGMRGLCVATVLDTVYDETQPGTAYLGNVDWDLLRTTDYWAHAIRRSVPMQGAANGVVARTVLGSGSNPRELFVSGGDRDLPANQGGHIFSETSPASGTTWVDESGGNPAVWGSERPFGLAVRTISAVEYIIAGVQGDGIWVKAGSTWSKMADAPLAAGNPDVQQVSISWEHDSVAYMVDRDSGLWRGTTVTEVMDTWELIWAFSTNNRSVGYCAVDPSNRAIVFVSRDSGLFRLENAFAGDSVGSGITQFNMGLNSPSALCFDENGWLYVTTVVGSGDVKFMRYQNPRVANPVGVDLADDLYRRSCVLPLCVDVRSGRAAVGCDGMGLIINNGLNENTNDVSDSDSMAITDTPSLNTGAELQISDADSFAMTDVEDAATSDNNVSDFDRFQLGDTAQPFEGTPTPVLPPPSPGIIPVPAAQWFSHQSTFTSPRGQVSVSLGEFDATMVPGGHDRAEATMPLEGFVPELFPPGAEWRTVGSDGHEVFFGWLLTAVVDKDRVRLTGRGTVTVADRNIRRMMFLSRNAEDWVPADSDPHEYGTGDIYSVDAQGSRIVFSAEKNDTVPPTTRQGMVFWAEGVQIHSFACTLEWNGQGGPNINVLRIQSALGPSGQLVQEGNDIPLTKGEGADRTIDRNVRAPGRRDLVWLGMHRVDNTTGSINAKLRMMAKNIRVRGLSHTDVFFAQDVVKEVCSRLNVDVDEVQADGFDLHALDQKGGSFRELLDLVSVLSGYRWNILHRGSGLYCEFGPWDDRTWITSRADGLTDTYALTQYNRVALRYHTTKGITRDLLIEPIDVNMDDPYENGMEVVFPESGPIELPDRYQNSKTVQNFGGSVLKQVLQPRLGGDLDRTWLRDLNGNVVPSYHAMPGDTLILQDFAPGVALAGRIVGRTAHDVNCSFSLDSTIMQAERLITKATRDTRS